MVLGAVLPRELTIEPLKIIEFAKQAERMGYSFLVAYDHVILPSQKALPPKDTRFYHNTYDNRDQHYESLTVLSAVAVLTNKIQLFTGVIVSPQRQTVLLAKQAAMVDLLSNGRLILGLGVGWNKSEYDALAKPFHVRGKSIDEQIPFLRKLWMNSTITHRANNESVDQAGIYPLPIQQPIPIWIGGQSDAAIQRAAKLADGWMPMEFKIEEFETKMDAMHQELKNNNRSVTEFGIMGKINPISEKQSYKIQLDLWKKYDISHLVISTTRAGTNLSDHIKVLYDFRNII